MISTSVSILFPLGLVLACSSSLAQTDLFSGPGNPLNLPVTTDSDRAVTALISINGGSIAATGGDGTAYTLTFPKDALLVDTNITLTPITAIDERKVGSPGGPAAGVKLDPDGLRLYQKATLVIQPPRDRAAGAPQWPAGYHGAGDNFHGEPLELSEATVTIKIMHFCGVVDLSYMGDGIRIPLRTPQEFEDRVRQYISELVMKEREAQMNNQDGDPEFMDKVASALEQYYDRVIGPLMMAAETDCDLAQSAVPKGVAFAREAEIWSPAEGQSSLRDKSSAVLGSTRKAVQNCWEKQKSRCRWEGDRARLMEILSAVRQLQLQGGTASLDEVPICNGWVGDFSSTSSDFNGLTRNITAHANFVQDPKLGNGGYSVKDGTMTWIISGTVFGCALTSGGGPLTFTMNPGDGILSILPGNPNTYQGSGQTYQTANLTITCPSSDPVTIPYGAGGIWFATEPGNPAPVPADGKTIQGSYSTNGLSAQWKFIRSGSDASQ